MSTRNLVVKSRLTLDSGSATLRQFNSIDNSIDKKGVMKFFKCFRFAYLQSFQKTFLYEIEKFELTFSWKGNIKQ